MRKKNPIPPAGLILLLLLGCALLLFFFPFMVHVEAQQPGAATPAAGTTGTPPSGAFITVTYMEPINVRGGPSSFDYPVVGQLPVGATAAAIGRSPANEWIEISFPAAPRGTAWVYGFYVSLTPPGFLLPIVEPPPTPTPLETPTINLTFEAAFQNTPTPPRLSTFTAPPALTFPNYSSPERSSSNRAGTTWVFISLGCIGILGIALSSIRRK